MQETSVRATDSTGLMMLTGLYYAAQGKPLDQLYQHDRRVAR